MIFTPLLLLLAWLTNVFVWAFVFGQRDREPVSRAFLLFAGASAGWVGLELLFYVPAMRGHEEVVLRATIPLWVPIGFLFMHSAYQLVGRRRDPIYWIALAATAAATAFNLGSETVLLGYRRYDWGVADVRDPFWHLLVCLVPVSSSLWGLWLVARRLKRARGVEIRRPLRLVVGGGVLTLGGVFVLNVALPDLFGIVDFPRLGSATMSVFVLVIFFAVSRYRFLTITVEQAAEELFEDLGDGIVLADVDGRVRRMNRAARGMLATAGAEEAELDAEDLLLELGDEVVGESRIVPVERRGERRELLVSGSRQQRGGIETGLIVVLRDVTEQQRAERVLRRTRNELEREVRRRTEELEQAQEMEAIGALAGGIAHDFNNLLAAILGFATSARDELPGESRVRADIEEVISAASRARDTVEQMLAFGRRERPSHQTLEVGRVVEDALKLLEVSLPPDVSVSTDLRDCGARVLGDASQIQQAVINFCTNAREAIRGRGEIRVETGTVELNRDSSERRDSFDPGRYVRIEVRDDGVGMPPEVLRRAFDPLFTTRRESSGLGLAIVRRIVRDHGGDIRAQSEPGKGSSFELLLPRLDMDEVDLGGFEGRERIMVVDDHAQVGRLCRRMLEPLGYSVTALSRPHDAHDSVRRDPAGFDLVITDQVMPEMTGLELYERLRSIRVDLPVILLAEKTVADGERAAGADLSEICDFVPKPLDRAALVAAVRRLLDAAGRGGRTR